MEILFIADSFQVESNKQHSVGCIDVPFTACGVRLEGSKLSWCSRSWVRVDVPATDISAPESGRILMSAEPFREITWILIVGARLTLLSVLIGDRFVVFMSGTDITLVDG